MNKNKLKLSLLILIIASIQALTGCNSSSEKETEGSAKAKFTINVANMGLPHLNVIKEKGWLEEEFAKIGAEVEWSNHTAGPPINEGFASKRIDLAPLGEGAILSAMNNGIDIKLVSLLSDGLHDVNYIIANKNSDINEISDLKGKNIGVNLGTSHHVFLLKALESVGLDKEDIKPINLTIADAQPAFQSDQLDAWVTVVTFAQAEQNTNGARLIASGESLGVKSPTFYITRGAFAKEHPEAVEIFLKVIDRAIELEQNNYEEYIDLVAKATGRERELVKNLSANAEYGNNIPSDEILIELQKSADILKGLGYLSKDLDVKSFVDNTYLKEK